MMIRAVRELCNEFRGDWVPLGLGFVLGSMHFCVFRP